MCWYYTPPRGKAVTKMRMTRKSPKSFLDAKSCVESVSEVFLEVPARPDELGTLLLGRDSRNRTAQYLVRWRSCPNIPYLRRSSTAVKRLPTARLQAQADQASSATQRLLKKETTRFLLFSITTNVLSHRSDWPAIGRVPILRLPSGRNGASFASKGSHTPNHT